MQKAYYSLLIITSILIFPQCKNDQSSKIYNIVTDYYQTYQARTDYKKFMTFYAEDIVLDDVINKTVITGKEELLSFFDWTNPSFQKVGDHALEITDQHISNLTVTTSGNFSAFQWDGKRYEPMRFTTVLTFNPEGKIIRQLDWIDYPDILRR